MSRSLKCLLALALQILAVRATCYNRDGTVAGDNYRQCPGQKFCCASDQKCTASGLCQAAGNNLPDTTSVFTYLYTSPGCTSADFSGCLTECTNATVAKVAPIWACNTGLTNYCCHVSQSPLPDPQSCCKDSGALFQLQQAVVIPWDSAVSVAAASSASAQLSSNAAMSANAVTTSTNTASSASRATTTLPPLSAFTSGITLTTDPAVIASHDASAAAAASVAAAYANGMSHATQVAVGVGVGVGIAFLSILATLFWRVRSLQSLLRKDTEGHGEVRTRGVYEPAPTHDEATLCARAEKTAAATTAVAAVPAVPAEVETTGQIHEMPSRFRSELP